MPDRLLLIAPYSSYRIQPYLSAAQELGCEVLVASEGQYSLVSAIAQGIQIDFTDPAQAEREILADPRVQACGAVLGTDDGAVALAQRIAAQLDLPHNPERAAQLARRKDWARAALAEAGLPVPAHRVIDLRQSLAPQLRDLSYPVVVKPLAMSASRGVIRANDEAQLRQACERTAAIIARQSQTQERHQLLVEGYLPGAELAVEAIMDRGRLRPLALFDKPDPLEGPFFEETYYVTPSRHPQKLQQQVLMRLEQACRVYGIENGPVHAEFRLHQGEAWILELAARTIGGQCARLLRYGTGMGLEELVIRQALGRDYRLAQQAGGGGVLMLPIEQSGVLRRVEGVLAAQRVPHIEDVEISVREGYELVGLPEGNSYLGFIFAQAPDAEQAEQALRDAYAELRVVVAPFWRIETQTGMGGH